MTRGSVPGLASDVFTLGLMLYELLAGEHPYWRDDQAEYATLVRAYAARPPALIGTMLAPARNADVSAALHRCLSPDIAVRPSAVELRNALSGRGAKSELPKPAARPATSAARAAPAVDGARVPTRTQRAPLVSEGIELLGPDGRGLKIGVRTELGKALVRQFGPEGEFWDDRQCVVERRAGREWIVAPFAGTTNETLLNGKTLTAPAALRNGDRIAVGREEKGLIKLPLMARGR
ncbi:MAG: FHA domain-containing protein, partial [Polyangiaceae bacterium]